jgi:tRNA threonylcarbamoyladenosine biosynthesis protein TsaB
MNTLIIDTTDSKKTTIKLKLGNKIDTATRENKKKSQIALVLIDELFKKNKLKPKDIDEIKVNTGPGSFTGTRVGVSIANALGFGLDIPINKKKKSALPKYF